MGLGAASMLTDLMMILLNPYKAPRGKDRFFLDCYLCGMSAFHRVTIIWKHLKTFW